jgi:hypothetical protein
VADAGYNGRIKYSKSPSEEVVILEDKVNTDTINGPAGPRTNVYIHHGPGMSEGCLLGQTGKPGQASFIAEVKKQLEEERQNKKPTDIRVILEERNAQWWTLQDIVAEAAGRKQGKQ